MTGIRTALAGICFAVALQVTVARADVADAIYSAGPIITMRGREPELVEALAVKDGRISFVGPMAEARGHAGPATRVAEWPGRWAARRNTREPRVRDRR